MTARLVALAAAILLTAAGAAGARAAVVHEGPVVAATMAQPARAIAGPAVSQPGARVAADSSFPPGYATVIDRYLTDVAADSVATGGGADVYGIQAQYGASSDQVHGPGVDSASFDAGSDATVDGDPFPPDGAQTNPQGCIPAGAYGVCLTDAQIRTELSALIAANGWDASLHTLYLVFLAPGIDECLGPGAESATNQCSDTDFCSYHSAFTNMQGQLAAPVYAVLPFDDDAGCASGQSPNGDPAADDEISVITHEMIETITDPLMTGWLGAGGLEVADKCAGYSGHPGAIFGAPLGSTASGEYNQQINGDDYWIQEIYSNLAGVASCQQRPGASLDGATLPGPVSYNGGPVLGAHAIRAVYWDPPTAGGTPTPTAAITASGASAQRGQTVTFTAAAGNVQSGVTVTYQWSFGDGATSSAGPTVTHAYAASGTHTVTLTVFANGFPSSPAQQSEYVFQGPAPALTGPSTPVTAGQSAQFAAGTSNDPDGTITAWSWQFGDGAAATGPAVSHTYAAPGAYTVTLTLTDSNGVSASAAQTVTVTAAPVGGSSGGSSRPPGTGTPRAGAAAAQAAANRALAALILHPVSATASVVAGRVVLDTGRVLECPAGGGRCTASVLLTSGATTLGRAALRLRPNGASLVRVTLNAKGGALLRRHRRLTARLAISETGASGASAPAGHVATTLSFTAPRGLPARTRAS